MRDLHIYVGHCPEFSICSDAIDPSVVHCTNSTVWSYFLNFSTWSGRWQTIHELSQLSVWIEMWLACEYHPSPPLCQVVNVLFGQAIIIIITIINEVCWSTVWGYSTLPSTDEEPFDRVQTENNKTRNRRKHRLSVSVLYYRLPCLHLGSMQIQQQPQQHWHRQKSQQQHVQQQHRLWQCMFHDDECSKEIRTRYVFIRRCLFPTCCDFSASIGKRKARRFFGG